MDINLEQYITEMAKLKSELRLLQFSEDGIVRCLLKMNKEQIEAMVRQYWAFQESGIEVDGA